MNLGAVLVTGLFAGGVSCAAVQGGLLTGLITRQRAATAEPAAPLRRAKGRTHRGATADTPPGGQSVVTAERRSRRARLGDDLVPVGGFLAGKLVSHTVLGALLGAVGGAVELSVGLRTWLQIGAGLLIVVFGLAQLGVPGFRRIVVEPPISWMKLVRNRARSQAAVAPALLGVATVLIPCGVTLSVEALALASGSPLTGAATMAVFVLGTGPLFAVLGYAARKAATAWRGRLAAVTGLVVLAMGLYTLNGGLELAGSPLSAGRIAQAVAGSQPPADTAAATTADGRQTVVITARTGSYSPENVQVQSGVPTTLVVKSDGAQGCVRSFVIRDEQKILPIDGETRIDLGVLRPGRLDYACGMGMYTGVITIV
ncbi:Heavy-metal-associated domain (N-terminus) and membrane-bounded cytochrome biogenesis cycZ-like domain, possible membrane copper tolerance protein [Alloactinosynnema sp. L-07]|uniref:sulfite exporter TauE/SafE family protein n=1 Tax=Alloactinosynnema sp. L-07 TaxID=1653480 RepID=UPI00065EF4DB|nr:sulfite exporter TauE/SafE family protein [Alloactinosynnema sp. L-07]CRK55264.1 Heavy-metal-associated domain (N-terminus) and membrane-bounded cytochrome biogenesis cycZ-like domain, possible membrane copper tolerance protein [Alloactinosynnema sp. L-07]